MILRKITSEGWRQIELHTSRSKGCNAFSDQVLACKHLWPGSPQVSQLTPTPEEELTSQSVPQTANRHRKRVWNAVIVRIWLQSVWSYVWQLIAPLSCLVKPETCPFPFCHGIGQHTYDSMHSLFLLLRQQTLLAKWFQQEPKVWHVGLSMQCKSHCLRVCFWERPHCSHIGFLARSSGCHNWLQDQSVHQRVQPSDWKDHQRVWGKSKCLNSWWNQAGAVAML